MAIDEKAFKAVYHPQTDVDQVAEWRSVIETYEANRNKQSSLYVCGPSIITQGDMRDPDSWQTTVKYPTKTPEG